MNQNLHKHFLSYLKNKKPPKNKPKKKKKPEILASFYNFSKISAFHFLVPSFIVDSFQKNTNNNQAVLCLNFLSTL